MASSTFELIKPLSRSSIKSGHSGSSSGNYIIDPDGKGGVAPFSVYCDMSDNGQKCNCYNGGGGGWREDSGLLTDKSALPVSQIRLADFDDSGEEGYHTLGKLKCYG